MCLVWYDATGGGRRRKKVGRVAEMWLQERGDGACVREVGRYGGCVVGRWGAEAGALIIMVI